MLLRDQARKALSITLTVGCFLKIYPYRWNPRTYRLLPVSRFGNALFRLHEIVGWTYMAFLIIRFIQIFANGIGSVPPRLWLLHLMFSIGWLFYNICNLQFDRKRTEIMLFVNDLFQETETMQRVELGRSLKKRTACRRPKPKPLDKTSIIIIFVQFMLIVNPPTHSTQLLSVPCAPQYLSSVIYSCKDAADNDAINIWQKLPFVILEDLMETDLMFAWTFNCTMVFLASSLIRFKFKETERLGMDFNRAYSVYRRAQVLMLLMKDSFSLYLSWFPSILFTIAGVFIFSAIRYQDLPFHLWILFPFCGLRCFLEGMTVLSVTGKVHQQSKEYLRGYLKPMCGVDEVDNDQSSRKYKSLCHKACEKISCSAGSMYTFENSIVIVTLSNTIQLVFTMLVTFKAKSLL